ncbi:GNAT domain [Macleaya cordata]|uniref:GNAT domain n=1 Tax=Macleaya cordata TaxID=56857 RepID=A0A200R268_MACCD|nr:GNAT domain [Macleaya cordata]
MEGAQIENNNTNNNKVLIREYNEERDIEMVERLERNCEYSIGSSSKGMMNIPTIFMGDPLCRVAEMVGSGGELVGIVRGCIKCVGTGFEGRHVKMGCILGLRVSPKHRRSGIGLKLVKCVENWAIQNGAEYISMAVEENNVASTNLFVCKCNYVKLRGPLIILTQPIHHSRNKDRSSRKIKIHKLSIEQAISLYKNRLGKKEFFPMDIDAILNEKLSLGTWVSFFKDENWVGLHGKNKDDDNEHEFTSRSPSSWAMNWRPSGYLLVYGIHGEGERVGELMKSLWWFAYNLGRNNVEDCKLMITELGLHDPLTQHVPKGTSMSCTNDFWYLKKVNNGSTSINGDEKEKEDTWIRRQQPITNLFVDPRDF